MKAWWELCRKIKHAPVSIAWYLDNQIDWISFGTKTKVLRGEIGYWPHNILKLRLQYYNTHQATPTETA